MKKYVNLTGIGFVLMLMFSSCGSYKKLTYLQDLQETGSEDLFEKSKPAYQLQPADLLYIQIVTANEEINQLFNPFSSQNASQQVRPESVFYTGYLVSDSG